MTCRDCHPSSGAYVEPDFDAIDADRADRNLHDAETAYEARISQARGRL